MEISRCSCHVGFQSVDTGEFRRRSGLNFALKQNTDQLQEVVIRQKPIR
jgi:hypothetical protein